MEEMSNRQGQLSERLVKAWLEAEIRQKKALSAVKYESADKFMDALEEQVREVRMKGTCVLL